MRDDERKSEPGIEKENVRERERDREQKKESSKAQRTRGNDCEMKEKFILE